MTVEHFLKSLLDLLSCFLAVVVYCYLNKKK